MPARGERSRRHDAQGDPGRRRPGADPAAPRPPHDGDAAAPAHAADEPAVVDVQGRPGRGLRPDRPGPAGALPVLHHVPGHQRDHAARAVQRHARAAARDADGQARLPVRLRPRLRADGRGPVGARRRRSASGCSASTSSGRSGCSASSRSPTPCSARRSACSCRRSRRRSSRRCSSCRPWWCRRCCCAGCWCRATRCPDVLERDQRRAAAVVRRRRDADADRRPPTPATCGATWRSWRVFAVGGLALGAATLRRRTA